MEISFYGPRKIFVKWINLVTSQASPGYVNSPSDDDQSAMWFQMLSLSLLEPKK